MDIDRIRNIVYGFAIGDALGVPFEFKLSGHCQKYYDGTYMSGTHGQMPGTWSDDTSILLCVLDSRGDIDKYKQNLKDWYNNSSKFNCFGMFDIGGGMRTAIENNFTNDSSESKGNACLCVALGCWLLRLEEQEIEDYIKLTHNNEESIKACRIYLGALDRIILGFEGEPDNSGHCMGSIKIALMCIKDYSEAVKQAIGCGWDTDSNASFAGSLSVANGNKIPQRYIDGLQGKEKIDNIINSLK